MERETSAERLARMRYTRQMLAALALYGVAYHFGGWWGVGGAFALLAAVDR